MLPGFLLQNASKFSALVIRALRALRAFVLSPSVLMRSRLRALGVQHTRTARR